MQYIVTVTETITRQFKINADSEWQATDKAIASTDDDAIEIKSSKQIEGIKQCHKL